MRYPLIINGETTGAVKIEPDGLFMRITGEYPGGSGLVRLSLYGNGREEYLGVMQPCEGGLKIKRRMTCRDFSRFPKEILCAMPRGEIPPQTLSAKEPAPKPQSAPTIAEAPTVEAERELQETEKPWHGQPEELLWFSTPQGVLTAFDGKRSLLAIPAERRAAPRGMMRVINGRYYVVFPRKTANK